MYDLFPQLGAYPFPFGSTRMGELAEMSDAELQRLPSPRLRDQAVSVDRVFEYFKGDYSALWHVAEHQGMTPYLDTEIARAAGALRRIRIQPQRLRALLDAAPQPRDSGRRN